MDEAGEHIALKDAIDRRVAECRAQIALGGGALDIQDLVQEYCLAVAKLPESEKDAGLETLRDLLADLSHLRDELTATRETVQGELGSLGQRQRANVAYQKSDAIGVKHRPPEDAS